MGLEIVAISRLTKQKGGDIKIKNSTGSLYPEKCYSFIAGEYEPHLKSRVMEIDVGSNGTFDCFRNMLCQCVFGITSKQMIDKWEDYEGVPFYEIINFSKEVDSLMCHKTCDKLYKDFNDHLVVIDDLIDGYDSYDKKWFLEIYDKMTKVFKMTKKEGIIIFS